MTEEADKQVTEIEVKRESQRVAIKSDGSVFGTTIKTEDGRDITNVTGIFFRQEAGDVAKVDISIIAPEVSIMAAAKFELSDEQEDQIRKAIEDNPEVQEALITTMERLGFIFLKRTA